MTTLKVTASTMSEAVLIRCNLTEASSPVEVDYLSGDGEGWQPTQYQCANVQHRESGLADLGAEMLAKACECSVEDLGEVEYEVIADKATWTVHVVRDAIGEYIAANGDRTPSSDEAMEFDSQEEAQGSVTRATDRVLSREVSEAT